MHTNLALGLRAFSDDHSRIKPVSPDRVASTQDWLSETNTTRSTLAHSAFSCASGAEQLVPPPPMEASFTALVSTSSAAERSILTTRFSNGSTHPSAVRRRHAAAT